METTVKLTLYLLSCHVVLGLPFRRQPQGRLIVFGDSFSDNGNGSWVSSNRTWPADPAYYNHQFSNGPVWGDYLSKTLGIPLLDYAHGGATTDNTFVTGYTGVNSDLEVPSATDKIESFLAQNTVQEGDIFVHWIGINDILFNTSITGAQITSLVTRNVGTLFRAGAQTVVLASNPLANRFPATYGSLDYIGDPISNAFAATLATGLRNIAAGYEAYMQIGVVDIMGFYDEIFANPEAYGIDPSYVHPPTACLKNAYLSEGVPRSLCDDPARHLYFDGYHPVTQVHGRIAGLFHDTLMNLM